MKYYSANKMMADNIYDSYQEIELKLPVKKMILRNNFWSDHLSLSIGVAENYLISFSFDKKLGDLLYKPNYNFDDSLMMKNTILVDSLVESGYFDKFIGKVINSKFRQIEAQENYFFITMGDRAKHSSHPDMQTGLLFTTDEKHLTYRHYIRKIDDNVYIYESVVP